MAKRITANDTDTTVIKEPSQETAGDTQKTSEVQEADVVPPAPEPEKKYEPKTASQSPMQVQSQEIPDHADRILKTLSSYPKLYIDFQGGTFTVDTPPAFRSNATLYTNPYYKS